MLELLLEPLLHTLAECKHTHTHNTKRSLAIAMIVSTDDDRPQPPPLPPARDKWRRRLIQFGLVGNVRAIMSSMGRNNFAIFLCAPFETRRRRLAASVRCAVCAGLLAQNSCKQPNCAGTPWKMRTYTHSLTHTLAQSSRQMECHYCR
jgi:hypothetical protein